MKITKILLLIAFSINLFSCSSDNDLPEPFDYAAQAIKDDKILETFLETHYYTPPTSSEKFGVVDTITNGETPLINQVSINNVSHNNIDYKLYYIKALPLGINESPSKIDSALVNYKGLLLNKVNGADKTVFDSKNNYTFWANLSGGVIPGWSYGIPNFKSGTIIPNVLPFQYQNTGKGVIFIPSGLAYNNFPQGPIPASSPLMFHIELALINRNDHDRDNVDSIYEDLDQDNDFSNDDTDNDEIPDYLDLDDDGDNILTKYENADPNNDGNPDDAIDTDGDNTPDYLDDDDDGDGNLTKNEDADPNNDGNPSDAQDSDGDNIPDYLDAN